MGSASGTRASLLLRLKDPSNHEAWEEFVDIYQPVLYRMARSRGFQDADAKEVVQSVFLSITRKIHQFSPNRETGSFRSWLSTLVRHQCINMFARQTKLRTVGGSEFMEMVSQIPARTCDIETILEEEHRRQLFYWAANKVRDQISESTWQAFWLTCVMDVSIEQASKELNISVGSIYVSRSRIIRRIKDQIQFYHSRFEDKQS